MWHVFATTGMRRGEVLGLRWDDIDLKEAQLTVHRSLSTVGHQVVESQPKTRTGIRMVGIDRATVEALKQHRVRQHEEPLLCGAAWFNAGYVFVDEIGGPLHPNSVTRAFRTLHQEAGLPKIRLHDLRHGWATMALGAGVPAKVVSERLGHSSIAVTLDTYSHVLPQMQSEAAERVAQLLR